MQAGKLCIYTDITTSTRLLIMIESFKSSPQCHAFKTGLVHGDVLERFTTSDSLSARLGFVLGMLSCTIVLVNANGPVLFLLTHHSSEIALLALSDFRGGQDEAGS